MIITSNIYSNINTLKWRSCHYLICLTLQLRKHQERPRKTRYHVREYPEVNFLFVLTESRGKIVVILMLKTQVGVLRFKMMMSQLDIFLTKKCFVMSAIYKIVQPGVWVNRGWQRGERKGERSWSCFAHEF